MSRPLKEAGFSLNQLDQRVEQLEAGRDSFNKFIEDGGKTLFKNTLNKAREKGIGAFSEAVLEVGDRREAVLDVLKSRGLIKVGSRIQEMEDIADNHPAAEKITRIERLQAGGYIDEADAVPAIDHLRDWVPNAPQEKKSESVEVQAEASGTDSPAGELGEPEVPVAETWLDLGTPAEIGEAKLDGQLSPEDERIAALKAEFRAKLESIKIPPTPKSIMEALINGGYLDEEHLLSRSDLAIGIFKGKPLEQALANLSVHMVAANKATVGVMNIQGRKPESAKQVGYFLSVLEPGAPIATGVQEPDIRPNPEDERIAALKAEFRAKLEEIIITPIPKSVVEAIINGGHFDEDNLFFRQDMALAVYPDRDPDECLSTLSYQLNTAENAIKGVMGVERRKPAGAKQVGYFLSFSQPS